MTHRIIIQLAVDGEYFPTQTLLRRWARSVLTQEKQSREISIRIIDEHEMTTLNSTYRHKAESTNVLSFPFAEPMTMRVLPLGDIAICAAVVNREALQQGKDKNAHWAHMVVHGVLHLQGFDHVLEEDAEKMEALEIALLANLGFANPYEHGDKVE